MLLVVDSQPRGIRCDLTGKELLDKFSYYSIDGTLITVQGNKKNVQRETNALDLDICVESYDEIYNKVKSNLGQIKPGAIKCDLSTRYLTGNFQYWSIVVSYVQVDVGSQDPMTVEKAIFDFNASLEEMAPLIALRGTHRAKPFSVPTQGVPKREVKVIAAPKPAAEKPKERPKRATGSTPEPEFDLTPEEITKPRPS